MWPTRLIGAGSSTRSGGPAVLPSSARARPSAISFHDRSTASVYRSGSLSIRLPHVWHAHIAFFSEHRSSAESAGLYRGPPGDAAVMCAATPTFITLLDWVCGPDVGARQSGLLHRCPA